MKVKVKMKKEREKKKKETRFNLKDMNQSHLLHNLLFFFFFRSEMTCSSPTNHYTLVWFGCVFPEITSEIFVFPGDSGFNMLLKQKVI